MWSNYPLGRNSRTSRDEYLRLLTETQFQSYPEVDKFEADIGCAISSEWLNELALHTQIVVKKSALCYAHGRVLYSALSQYLKNNCGDRVTIWETGTARVFSALCMTKALHDLGQSGTVVTFDLLPHRQPIYWNCIDDLDGPKSRAELLEPWRELLENYVIFVQGDTRIEMPKVKSERINFAFLDGAHAYDDVMFEYNQIADYQEVGDVIVFDDYTPEQFPALVDAIDQICQIGPYEKTIVRAHDNRGYLIATKY